MQSDRAFVKKILTNVLGAVGETPLVMLNRMSAGLPGRVAVKLEFANPGASMKDRPAARIILQAEKTGALGKGQTVIERTSGNMGTGLAIACAVTGHPLVTLMSEGNSMERVRMLRALGAKVVRVPQVDGKPGQVTGRDLQAVEQATLKLQKKLGAFRADQFNNPEVVKAHHFGTGREIWRQTDGAVDCFTSVTGSAGMFMGVVGYLKKRKKSVRAFLVEPLKAAILSGKVKKPGRHKLQGVGYASVPALFDPSICDGYLQITDREATQTARELAAKEGIFAGYTSGANVAAALRLAREAPKGQLIVTIICDSGLKYLSTDLYR